MSWLSEQEEKQMRNYVDQYNSICRKIAKAVGNKDYHHKNYDLTFTLTNIKDEPIKCEGGIFKHMKDNPPEKFNYNEIANNLEVKNMLPNVIKPNPSINYVIGADFYNNEAHFCIFNKDTNAIEYQAKLFTTSIDDYNTFCIAIAKYFNAKLLKEKS